MIRNLHRLSFKVSGILIGFSVIAIAAIGATLYVSWKLQGGAAAINDMGSERMRAYRIANILSELAVADGDREAVAQKARAEIDRFERVLRDLEQGDPGRPLFVPATAEIRAQLGDVERRWRDQIRPAAEAVLAAEVSAREALFREFRGQVDDFVARVDALVGAVEAHNSRYTSLLGTLQLGLMALAVAGAVALIFMVFLLVVRPVQSLAEGMQRMEREEFGARVPVETQDEFGELARGFNRMADHLEGLYRTLEDRVKAKTRRLEQKNRELSTLYDVSTFLNTPGTTEELCRGFVRRLIRVFDAGAGSVRLVHPDSGDVHMFVSEGLTRDFVEEERCLKVGECLCGEAVRDATPMVRVFPAQAPETVLYRCQRIGFETVSVFTIRVKKQLLGVFNLYFRSRQEFTHEERLMLETLGQHLGIAIENQRLLGREREMAVSEERNLLAQELHDSIAQSLAFLNLQTQMLQDALQRKDTDESLQGLALIREGIQESYDDVRELLVHFRTRIDEADIEAALRATLEKFEGQTGIATGLEIEGTGIPLSPEAQIQVLHIVQEALSNVRKHSDAKRVDVSLVYDHSYCFTVRDDGCGFDVDSARERMDDHVGLKIMRERAHRIGGRLDMRSRPGEGTQVTLTLPIAKEEAAA
jgi:two-component system nitrate/nitrite sensor histidine kinase NarX